MGLYLKDISAILYDFDGVMTDNTAMLFADGSESVRINRSDGLAVQMFSKCSIIQAIITSEHSLIADKRAEKLKIPVIHTDNKLVAAQRFLSLNDVLFDTTCFIGNDLNDILLLQKVAFPICPEDAYIQVKSICKLILPVKGGCGVIRSLWEVVNNGC